MRARSAPTRGVTLIEVLVAFAMLAIVLIALLPMFTMGMKTNSASNELGIANTLAGEKLEELSCYPSTDPRLAIPNGQTSAQGTDSTQANYSAFCANDLPLWYKPAPPFDSAKGTVSYATASPGGGWYPYPFRRTYTVSAFTAPNATTLTPVPSTASDESVYNAANPTPYYGVKLVNVTVQLTAVPGAQGLSILRRTTQSGYVRFRNVN